MNARECFVLNCKERFGNDLEGVILCRFPEDEEDRKKWLTKCGREVTYDCSKSVVCSRHFCIEDFEKVLKGNSTTLTLKRGVVPHLNLFKVKEEPPDSDEYEYENQLSPPTNSPDSVITKAEVDSSFFATPITKEDHPNAGTSDAIPVEPIQVTSPIINSVSSSSVAYAPSSLPASQNWSGLYDFTVSFGPQQKTTKGVSWTYSSLKDKLYVGKDIPCPINFSATISDIDGITIRATALYSTPEHASKVVHRCKDHSMTETSEGVFEAEHLVRCESQRATYEEDKTTKRHSVVVPFEHPPAGQLYSTYLYKFTCFGSCNGGPNRRPLMLIFSLEKGGEVVGRRKLDVKICACPGRDRKTEEQLETGGQPQLPVKRKEKEMTEPGSMADVFQFANNIYLPPSKKLKPNKSGPYNLNVSDKECYEFLKQMKSFFEMCKTVNNLPAPIKSMLMNHRHKGSKKSGPENEESDSDQ